MTMTTQKRIQSTLDDIKYWRSRSHRYPGKTVERIVTQLQQVLVEIYANMTTEEKIADLNVQIQYLLTQTPGKANLEAIELYTHEIHHLRSQS